MRIITLTLLVYIFAGCKQDKILEPIMPVDPIAKVPTTKEEFILEKSNPWVAFTPDHTAAESIQNLDYEFTILTDNSVYGSFILTNVDSVDQILTVEISNTSALTLKLFEVKQVTTNSGKVYSDPIVRVASEINLPKDNAKLYIFQLQSASPGIFNATISITNGSQKKNIAIQTKIIIPSLILDDLNAVNWSYLHLPLIKDRMEEVGKDLYDHHINTSVVSFHVIPRIESTDFSSIINYVSTIKDVKNILIHAYPKTNNKTAPLLSAPWKKLFIIWYTNMLSALSNAGYSVDNIYFYPYDEISIERFSELEEIYTWAKKAIPNFKFYATVVSEETANKVVPLIELSQLIHLHNPKLIENHYSKKGELWLYNTFGKTYALSPYAYYRLMAWTAYFRDIKGVGFWNYADMAKKTSNPIDATIDENFNGSYSIIYTGEGKEIISSRRWEAFRLGIEDYRILLLYEKKFGKEKTKAMVWNVLSAKENYDLAEQVRAEMINSL